MHAWWQHGKQREEENNLELNRPPSAAGLRGVKLHAQIGYNP